MVFPIQLDISTLDETNGFVLTEIDIDDRSSLSLSGAGDVNGDGVDDIIVGAPSAEPNGTNDAGESYVVFGRSPGLNAQIDLASLDGSNGFKLNGMDENSKIGSVSGAGDINGDGIDDIIIGTGQQRDMPGKSYVVFGQSSGFNAQVDLSSLDGSNGFVLNGVEVLNFSEHSVSGAGDVNGDGIDDIIVGDPNAVIGGAYNAGQSYVVFGSDSGFNAQVALSSLDGTSGFTINGTESFAFSGSSVSGAGDVNGDGFADLIIRGYQEQYVVFGGNSELGAQFDLSSLDGSNGFRLNGISAIGSAGAVSGAGDVNGDGIDDIIVGIPVLANQESAGNGFIVFGRRDGFAAQVDLSSLDGDNGFILNGIDVNDELGTSVSSAGDVNGDGIGDIIIGASGADPNGVSEAGESYVVFGNDTGFDAQFDLSGLDGTNGFILNGAEENDNLGSAVSRVGDVNGDGVDDVIIGAHQADPNGGLGTGKSYVVFGNREEPIPQASRIIGTPDEDSLMGTQANDTLNGKGGDDEIAGDTGDDLLRGGGGHDFLVGGDGHDRLIGGNGIDTLGGSEGQDEFVIQNARQGADHITDFDIAEDEILLDISGFGLDLPKGKLANARFTVGEGAGDNSDRVIYNSQTGALMFDPDGYRSQESVAIAYLEAGLNLSNSNIRLY